MTVISPPLSEKTPRPRQPAWLCGDFPKIGLPVEPPKKCCRPATAGLLAVLYAGRYKGHAAIGEKEREKQEKPNNSFAMEMAKILASNLDFPNWERRLPAELKQHFAMLALARQPNAHAISIRLDHKTAEAALSAPKSPTDYLSALLRSCGLKDLVFCLEFADCDSDENHPLHLHGIVLIPADQVSRLADDLRITMASGYRQRYKNRAIDIQPIRTTLTQWAAYCSKDQQQTQARLQSNPFYASQSSRRAGKSLYEGIRAWLTPETPSQAP
jgi:hypothetical protein